MARRNITVLIDDLTGRELPDGAGETVHFSLDGINYELDLESKAAQKLRSSLSPFVTAGRRVPGTGASVRARRVDTAASPTAVRAWAAANGIDVADRGRIPGSVLSQFEAAGN